MSLAKTDVDGKILYKNSLMKHERVLYDVYDGLAQEVPEDAVGFYKDVLTRRGQLYLWAQLAYHIFQSNEKSYWDHAKKGWKGNFGEKGNYFDLIDYLCNQHKKSSGDDPSMSTGLIAVSSLDEVEQEAAKVAENLINRKLKAKDFIKACSIPPLHDKKEKQTILCTFAGNRDRYGKTFQFGYNVFGLAFYNFKISPVASDEIEYSTALNGRSIADAVEQNYSCPGFTSNVKKGSGTLTYPITNEGRDEGTFGARAGESNTVTLSNSITNSKQYSFGQSIGIANEWKVGGAPGIESTTRLTVEFSFQQVISTAYEETKSVTKSSNSESNISVVLPPHTALLVIQSGYEGTTELKYSCPVMVEFDVAVLSMCGTCYDDNAAVNTFSTAGYKQRSFCTLFDNQNSLDASENLYVRFNNYDSVKNYDKTHGTTKVMEKNKVIGEEIDWAKIEEQNTAVATGLKKKEKFKNEKADPITWELLPPRPLIELLTKYRPASSMGAAITEEIKKNSYQVKGAVPLFPLSRIQLVGTPNTVDLKPGDILYPGSWNVEGYDNDGVKFYGFDIGKGTWKIYDENGKVSNEVVCPHIRKLTNECVFKAVGEGEVYAVYEIDEGAYTCKNGNIDSKKIKTVSILMRVSKDISVDKIEIKKEKNIPILQDGMVDLRNLEGVTVSAYKEGKKLNVPVTWKVVDGDAMIMDNRLEMNSMQCKVVATYGGIQSNELELRVK